MQKIAPTGIIDAGQVDSAVGGSFHFSVTSEPVWYSFARRKHILLQMSAAGLVEIERQGDEVGLLEGFSAVSTFTLYETGEDGVPTSWLRERTGEILVANPWLAAVWRKKQLLYPASITPDHLASILDLHFYKAEMDLSDGGEVVGDYLQLMKGCQKHLVKSGDAMQKAKPGDVPFKVVLLHKEGVEGESEKGPKRFALLVSINHTLADGATFYNIYRMLSQDATVASLNRKGMGKAAFRDAMDVTLGSQERRLPSRASIACNMIGAVISDLWRGQKREALLCEVDPAYLERCKREHREHSKNNTDTHINTHDTHINTSDTSDTHRDDADVPFVSSNDILTSLVMGQVLNSDLGVFVVNLRGRVQNVGHDLAGNYGVLVPMARVDLAEPSLVRRVYGFDGFDGKGSGDEGVGGGVGKGDGQGRVVPVFTAKRAVTGSLPGGFACLRAKLSLMSNWATLHQDVNLGGGPAEGTGTETDTGTGTGIGGGCRQLLHLPMLDLLGPAPFPVCLVFRPSEGKLGVLVAVSRHGMLDVKHEAWGNAFLSMPKLMRL
jgi:hypothetical protein